MYYTIFAKREENFLAKIESLPSRERGLKSTVVTI